MRIACIYWYTSSVGGIATHLNALRTAAIKAGDTFDILHSRNWKTKSPTLFESRQWVRGGDTKIWIDGELPHHPSNVEESIKWLEENYDAVYFGFACPHPTKAYPEPDFLPLYDVNLPIASGVTDGYFEEYKDWAMRCLPKARCIFVVQPTYAEPLRKAGLKVKVSLAPFSPRLGPAKPKSKTPLVVWPNQWKNIKGINEFLDAVPHMPKSARIELYSNGIRYYQVRTEERWINAVKTDHFQQYHGKGRAEFFGNVDVNEITDALQRAWFTVNLQGLRSRKSAYQNGSYNLTEVEALFYGACPVLHSSASKTALPKETYLTTDDGEDIPDLIAGAISSGFALAESRRRIARDFVIANHLASDKYKELKEVF